MNKLTKTGGEDKATSNELLLYQMGELKNLMGNLTTEVSGYKKDSDGRLLVVEKFIVAQTIINQNIKDNESRNAPQKIDVQKIILAALALVSTVVASALGLNRNQ